MYKRVFLIITAFFCFNTFLSVLSSCTPNCGSDCTPATCFYPDSLSVVAFDEEEGKSISTTNFSVTATKLRLDVTYNGYAADCYSFIERTELSFFTKAYACSPAECPILMRGDSLVSYNIYSDKDYDTQHQAGASLNDIISAENFPIRVANNNGSLDFNRCSFHLNVAPADTGSHIFTIKFTQADGDIVTLNTPQIKILK